MRFVKLAVVGATGVVGETLLRVLHERGHRGEIARLASRTRDGVQTTTHEALEPYDVVFFCGSEDASETFAPPIVARGGIVIDNSSTFRMRDGVPLIVPEINAHVISERDRLFPVANCTAIILCVALAPIRFLAGLQRVTVATYQAVSGAGRAALEEFERGEGPIVHNVVPQIGSIGEDGVSTEERKIGDETRKIFDLPQLDVDVTAVRVPVRTAHSEAVFFETATDVSVAEIVDAIKRAPGVVYHDEGVVTPRDVEGTDDVHVARLRHCESADPEKRSRRFAMWIVGDQLRKGAATNAVQIFEHVLALRGAAAV